MAIDFNKIGRVSPVYTGTWNKSTAYERLDIVANTDGTAAYIARKDVPAGTALSNGDYWAAVLDVNAVIDRANASVEKAVGEAQNVVDTKAAALETITAVQPAVIRPENGSRIRPVMPISPIQPGSDNPYLGGQGAQLYDVSAMTSTTPTVDAEGWITCEKDNSDGESVVYAPAYTAKSELLQPNKTYTVVCEVKEISGGSLYAVQKSETSSMGQFGENMLVNQTGVFVQQIETRSDFANCETMLRTYLYVPAGRNAKCVFRLSVLESTDVSASAFKYAPYANIRPISGVSTLHLMRSGKNMIDAAAPKMIDDGASITASASGRRLTINGSGAWKGVRYSPFCISAGTQLALSVDVISKSAELRFGLRDADTNSFVSSAVIFCETAGHHSILYKPDADITVYPSLLVTGASGGSGEAVVANIQIEAADAPTEYEAYRGDAFAVDFGRTVYGGTLDLHSGTLTVDKAVREYDGISHDWVLGTSDSCDRFLHRISDAKPLSSVVCSHAFSQNSANKIGAAYINANGAFAWNFSAKDKTSLDDFKEYLAAQKAAGTPVQVCYELIDPVIIKLAPCLIPALDGLNTVCADAPVHTAFSRSVSLELENLHGEIGSGYSASPVEGVGMQRMLERAALVMRPAVAMRDMPRTGGKTIPAGTLTTGVNYSAVFRLGRLVGCQVLPSTYYSAMENPASKMYTEREYGDQTGRSSYYGLNCSGFVCYAMGTDEYQTTAELAGKYLEKVVQIDSIEDVFKLKRGDVLINTIGKNEDGEWIKVDHAKAHCSLLRDVVYDVRTGRLAGFDVSESWKPYALNTLYTPDDFFALLKESNDGPFQIVRPDAGDYSARAPVPVSYSNSVYPDKGDKAVYRTNEEIWLYIPDADAEIVYAKSTAGTAVHLISKLERKEVNGVNVHKLPADGADTYFIWTDMAPGDPAEISVVNTGTVNYDSTLISAPGVSANLTPKYVETIRMEKSDSAPAPGEYPAPEGYQGSLSLNSRKTVSELPCEYDARSYIGGAKYEKFYIRVWFADKNGSMVYVDSGYIDV